MNTTQALHFPRIRLLIVVLLVASLLAVLIPLAWSLLSAYLFPAPIQADSLKMADAANSLANCIDPLISS